MSTTKLKLTPIRELTDDEKAILIMLDQHKNVDEFFDKVQYEYAGWVLTAIQKRFQAYKLEVDKRVMIMVLAIGDGVIGKCAKYVDNIAEYSDEFKKTNISWELFTQKIYPFGIPIY